MQYPFKIYSSSAGSGKTFTLTKEYLKLALQQNSASYFKQILAITFTNDAATEMKERILGALKGFADPLTIPEGKRAGNAQLLQLLVEELNQYTEPQERVTEAILRKRAANTFRSILHDYSDFAVSTIDSFVNRLVNAFSEELNLPFNYEVDLDSGELLDNAIDRLLNRIGEEEERLLSETLEGYAMEKADEGLNWNNLSGDLAGFGAQLLNERVYEAVSRLAELGLKEFREIREELTKSQDFLKDQIAALADEALELISTHGLDGKCFVGGTHGIFGYFEKLTTDLDKRIDWEPTKTLLEALENTDWAPKALKADKKAIVNSLAEPLTDFYIQVERLKGEWMLISSILKHFYKLSVIHEINKELAFIKAEKNVVHISDFNKAIINIVLQEPVPFIYERLGEKYNHILIDEFQDTSVLQWNNLLPLVENSLAKGHFSMVVGDAKQAIYGWRGGDMEQIVFLSQKRFRELVERHEQAENLFLRYETLEHTLALERLNTNYRSASEIIRFNNTLFRLLADLYSSDKQLLGDIYDRYAEQQVPVTNPRDGGHIAIRFIEKEGGEDAETLLDGVATAYQLRTYDAIIQAIQEAEAAGYTHKDIAVLNRSNKNGKLVANFLKEQGIEVVSQDSLLLQNAPSIALLIRFLRLLNTPDQALLRYEALHQFHQYLLQSMPQWSESETQELLETTLLEPIISYISEKGFNLNLFRLQQSGIYEMCENLVGAFRLFEQPRQAPYLFRFLDVALEFSTKHSNHLADFMEYWEKKKEVLCINTPKDWQAVTVTSIHKSKGLEYPVVIIPFADWPMTPGNRDTFWLSLDPDLLSYDTQYLHQFPLRSAAVSIKNLGRTPLRAQFNRESEKIFIENFNALYVALTRPTDRLYLFTKKEDFEKKKQVNVAFLLYQYLEHTDLYDPDQLVYELQSGKPKVQPTTKEEGSEIFWLEQMHGADWQEKARLRRQAATVFDIDTFEKKKDIPTKLCQVLSRLPCADELDTCLEHMWIEGLIDQEEREQMKTELEKLLIHPFVQPNFDRKAKVKPVRDIVCRAALHLRTPDRVVLHGTKIVLLRFVAHPASEFDQKLLNRYAIFLQQMGYSDIEKIVVCTADGSALLV
jgi:ATP-dependent exoDNAse (exonuclease V) beta subunit